MFYDRKRFAWLLPDIRHFKKLNSSIDTSSHNKVSRKSWAFFFRRKNNMTPIKPICDLDRRYSQREAAELLGVERHTIRRWEVAGSIRFDMHKAGRNKFTTGRQILKCWETTYM